MKVLRIKVSGIPLFKEDLDIIFYAQQRVYEADKKNLYAMTSNIYLNFANAFIGINASGKTSVLKVIQLAFGIINNEPINHIEARRILCGSEHACFETYFYDADANICCLRTKIAAKKTKMREYVYSITDEELYVKKLSSAQPKKTLTELSEMPLISVRKSNEEFLPEDVSFIIAYNKKMKDSIEVYNLLSFTNVNVLPYSEEIPLEVITFLDPTIERLYFEQMNEKTLIHLKFKEADEMILNHPEELEQYLSSGTIKGIVTFSMVKDVLRSGGYLLMDEIENHFNKEIVTTLVRFFMDSKLNKKGGTLIFTTHYPELLDEFDRNDGIHIVRNRNGITVENLSKILERNDIKKSDAYQSGFLEGTTPAYEAYMKLKKSLAASVK